MLGDDEKPIVRSAFRSRNPRPVDPKTRLQVTEKRINKHLKKLTDFIKHRKVRRDKMVFETISAQVNAETNGIMIDELRMDMYNTDMRGYQNALLIHKF